MKERKSIFKRIGYLLMIVTLTIVAFLAPKVLEKEVSAAVDRTVPTLQTVTIKSDNNNQKFAKLGDTVTLSITASEDTKTPIVTIVGETLAVVEDVYPSTYKATYKVVEGTLEGEVLFHITYTDDAGNAGIPVTATTDSSKVMVDKTRPVIDPVSVVPINTKNALTWEAPITTARDNMHEDISNDIVVTYFKADAITAINLTEARIELETGINVVVKYNVNDEAGNVATEISATFTAIDNTSPVLELEGYQGFDWSNILRIKLEVEDISSWTPPTLKATDNIDGDISDDVVVRYFDVTERDKLVPDLAAARTKLIEKGIVGLEYNVSDAAGNIAFANIDFFTDYTPPVTDDIPPVLELEGYQGFDWSNILRIELEVEDISSWTPPVLKATDNTDGDISDNVVVRYFDVTERDKLLTDLAAARTKLIEKGIVGLEYNVSDAAGNTAFANIDFFTDYTPPTPVTDNIPPVIELEGYEGFDWHNILRIELEIEDIASWTPPTLKATDNIDGDVSDNIEVRYFDVVGGNLLTDLAVARTELKEKGIVGLEYNVSDAAGNIAFANIDFFTDYTPPAIVVAGATVTTEDAATWTAPLATVTDNINPDFTVEGQYYKADGLTEIELATAREELVAGRNVIVKYVSDLPGNVATEVFATFEALDTTAPKIALVEDATVDTKVVSNWTAPETTANDNKDGNLTENITIKYFNADDETIELTNLAAARRELTAGRSVVVKYNVSDAAGNSAKEVSATFRTRDITAPIITSVGKTKFRIYTITANENIREYSIDNGKTWIKVTTPRDNVRISFGKYGSYQIIVKDVAGNESKMKTVTYSRPKNIWWQWRVWK